MSNASEIYTLSAEIAAARLRGLLTTAIPPLSGSALLHRQNQPPSKIITDTKLPYKQRMWSPAGVDQWCGERQPPRIRKALACLARLEVWGAKASETCRAGNGTLADDILCDILAGILEGSEP